MVPTISGAEVVSPFDSLSKEAVLNLLTAALMRVCSLLRRCPELPKQTYATAATSHCRLQLAHVAIVCRELGLNCNA